MGTDSVNFLWRRDRAPGDGQQSDENTDPPDDGFDVSSSDIFDAEGNYVSQFLRSIIYVMDKHKISHEAYHETRMVTKGFMPPIHIIKEAKSIMSEEIEYIKHPTVCTMLGFNIKHYVSNTSNYRKCIFDCQSVYTAQK